MVPRAVLNPLVVINLSTMNSSIYAYLLVQLVLAHVSILSLVPCYCSRGIKVGWITNLISKEDLAAEIVVVKNT